jgi:23S rRNA (guanosine2251-2'-O)-methyltransferase
VAFRAPVLRAATVEEGVGALRAAGFGVFGLDAGGASLLTATLPDRVALVLGNETNGLSASVHPLLDGLLAIPMHAGVESLGVASAGAVASFELARRA